MSPGGSLTIIKSLKALIAGAACSPWVAFIGQKKRSKESARSLLTKPACPVPPVQAAQRAQSRPLVSSALSLQIKRKQNIKSFPKRSHLKAPRWLCCTEICIFSPKQRALAPTVPNSPAPVPPRGPTRTPRVPPRAPFCHLFKYLRPNIDRFYIHSRAL